MVSASFLFYASVIIIQTLIIMNLLSYRSAKHNIAEIQVVPTSLKGEAEIANDMAVVEKKNEIVQRDLDFIDKSKPKGVAATLLLHSPKWFQRRYTVMVQNIRNNIPKDWVIQIFYTGEGQSLAGIELNIGLKRMIERGEVIMTTIPNKYKKYKRIELMVNPWLWQNMLADRVLIFGGNSVICSNSPFNITYFSEWDYLGAPWSAFGGLGGEGGISLRNRQVMLDVIRRELVDVPLEQQETKLRSLGQEDQFFVSRLKTMLSDGSPVRVAPRPVTQLFAATDKFMNENVLAVSGTLAGLSFTDRDKFLSYCLELKAIYPSLHDPNCFGAKPNGEKCAENICALHPKKGGC